MLNAIRRVSPHPTTRPQAAYICAFCQRQPTTSPTKLGLSSSSSRHSSTDAGAAAVAADKSEPGSRFEAHKQQLAKAQANKSKYAPAPPHKAAAVKPAPKASPDLIREIRTEIEAHRQGMKEKARHEKEDAKSGKRQQQQPKAPKAKPQKPTIPASTGVAGRTLKEALAPRQMNSTADPDTVELKPIPVPDQPGVPVLAHDLDRVLFNPGVYFLQDPRTKVFNFDPYLQKLMPVNEFEFEALSEYITSSRDTKLEQVAKQVGKRYVGSTSSMTSILGHFHYLLSSWRQINPSSLSKSFVVPWKTFTALQRAPQAIFLRWKDGVYAIDADKEFDKESVLTLLGKSMEKLLTLPPDQFENYRRSNDAKVASTEPAVDTYHYSTLGDFLMRSQLDAYDARLPGTGMFDLKTRAVVSIRMDVDNFHIGSGYQIKERFGEWESFEREYFDMIRAAFLKYSLQVRMGRMDGIFVAFHNTERIFGFQYISLDEMDAAIHEDWNSGIGDREFKLSLQLLNDVLNKATEKYPEQSLRIHFEAKESQTPLMSIFAEPMSEEAIDKIQANKRTDLTTFLKDLGDKNTPGDSILETTITTEPEAQIEDPAATTTTEPEAEIEDPAANAISMEDEPEDTAWLAEMEENARKATEAATPPLLAFTLKIKNYVNSKLVIRPDRLAPNDKWQVQYDLEEVKGPRAWASYKSCLSRKQAFLTSRPEATEDFRGVYIQNIVNLSKKGREYISKVEKEQAEVVPVVWTATPPKPSS
ncbi:mitochondrial membrane protein Pet127 [Peziza echinospora]|nr:mitochondrial membrane protein Pet127 [Peziza echinospora]